MTIVSILIGCKGEESSIPVITINSPHENQTFHIGDTIKVSATVEDQRKIENIKLALTNFDFQPVQNAYFIYPTSNIYLVDTSITIYDQNLPSGYYYLQITADNGESSKNKFQKIFIVGIQKEFEKIIAITRVNSEMINVLEFDRAGNGQFVLEIAGDFTASEIDSKERQLYLAGKEKMNLQAYDIDEGQLVWELAEQPPIPYHAIDNLYFDEFLFSSFYFNYCKGYRADGSEIFSTTISDPELPSRIYRFDNLILADLQSKSGGITYIATYYLASGVEKQRRTTNFKVVDFFTAGPIEILISANSASNGILKMYNPYLNEITDIHQLPGQIISGVRISEDEFLLGFSDKIIRYDETINSFSDIEIGIKPYRLRYENIAKELYIAGASEIQIFSYPEMEYQASVSISDTLLNIHLLYNK